MPIFATNSARGPGGWASLSGLALVTGISLLIALCAPSAKADSPKTGLNVRAESIDEAEAPSSEVNSPSATIQMRDDNPMYQPEIVIIRAGETVEWINAGDVSHSVVDDPAKADKPADSLLPAGRRASRRAM